MAESLDSRKFERRAQFDVPLPIRKIQRMPVEPSEEEPSVVPEPEPNKMAFSLMTRKGNRQQVSGIRGRFKLERGDEWQVANVDLDQDNRIAFGFEFCAFDEIATGGGTGGTTANQEPGLEL